MSELKTRYTTIPVKWIEDYADSLTKHIEAVQEAGTHLLGMKMNLVAHHDDSKWEETEFPHYARQFHGDKGDPAGFAIAWLHHQNFNPHHWEHWITRSDHSKGGSGAEDGCLPMPERYALEMVADWMGASLVYTGSWDMTEWLKKNLSKIRLHSKTRIYVNQVLRDLNYETGEK